MKNSKNIMIIALLIAVVALAIGYAAFATTLVINGHAEIDANWDVEITNITATYYPASGGAEEITAASGSTQTPFVQTGGLSASFAALLHKPGDYAEYTITVSNLGNIDAKLDNIVTSPTLPDTASPSIIVYTMPTSPTLNTALDAPVAPATSTHTYVIRVTFDANATAEQVAAAQTAAGTGNAIEKDFTVTLDYVQK